MMYVVEGASVSSESMKISVIRSQGGARYYVSILPEFTVEKLKLMALSHFYNPIDSIKVADRYKLILVSDGRLLCEEITVRDETLVDGDELLLLKRRISSLTISDTAKEKEDKVHAPTDAEIQKITAGIKQKNRDITPEEVPHVIDFHCELRKILVSLVQTSEKILRCHPDIIELFKEVVDEEKEVHEDDVDLKALKQLTDMGFTKFKAVHALKLSSNAESAAEWLITNSDNESLFTSGASDLHVQSTSSGSRSFSERTKKATEHAIHPNTKPSTSKHSDLDEELMQNPVVKMIQRFRAYKRKIFRPNKTALSNLKEMGFSESDVLDALRINSNNQETACDWLLNDKKLNFEDMDNGLDSDGPIYKAIMENPVVQLGLCNPKTFLALLHMLENPNSACRWLSDPDTAPVLTQIFRIYHAEKHSVQLARPLIH